MDDIVKIEEDAERGQINLYAVNAAGYEVKIRTFSSRVGQDFHPLLIVGDDSTTDVQGIKEQLAAQNLGLAFPPDLAPIPATDWVATGYGLAIVHHGKGEVAVIARDDSGQQNPIWVGQGSELIAAVRALKQR